MALRRLRTGPILRRPAARTAVQPCIAQMKAIVHDFEVKRAVVLEQNEAALIEIGELPATHGIDPARMALRSSTLRAMTLRTWRRDDGRRN